MKLHDNAGRLPAHWPLGLLTLAMLLMSLTAMAADYPPMPPNRATDVSAIPGVAADPMWSDLGDAAAAASLGPSSLDNLPRDFRLLSLDYGALKSILESAPSEKNTLARDGLEITLPLPGGMHQRFRVVESSILSPSVQAQIPDFRSYLAQGVDDPTAVLRLDTGLLGFHAYGRTALGTLWINPYAKGDTQHYLSAYKHDFEVPSEAFECGLVMEDFEGWKQADKSIPTSGDQLRMYSLALTLTGEYCTYFGGTSPGTNMAASVVNRLNSVYEIDAAVRFNFDWVMAYGNPATDPFPSGGTITGTLLNQNQTNTDALVGAGNYDIGHIFTQGPGGGLAGLGVVCTTGKARGGTGSSAPVGDPFDIDYVAHEVGHQMGGPHTFNGSTSSCNGNRSSSNAYEPGSGSTIMAYAGICGAEDLQAHSDPYFHVSSLENIIATRNASGCGTDVATGNTPPVADAGLDYTIPRGTAFYVVGGGTDPDPNTLTYTWEQYDLGQPSPPTDPYGPLYRSFNPSTESHRYFPDWNQVFSGDSDPFEVMPSVDRSLTLRLTVRDNAAGGGGVDDDELELTVSGAPFAVTSPNGGESYVAGQLVTVTWDVGGSTAAGVKILLISPESGFVTLIGSTANDGSEDVSLPCGLTSTQCRLWVEENTGSVYGVHVLDVSNGDFSLTDGLPDFIPYVFPGWDDNVVVNPIQSPTLPLFLVGDASSYFYWSYANVGPGWGCEGFEAHANIDEINISTEIVPEGKPSYVAWGNGAQTIVRGGRHTAWEILDPNEIQPELDEANNAYARQWVWEPALLTDEATVTRMEPPLRFAGTEHIPAGVTSYANMDALRIVPQGSTWHAAAISSLVDSDYDIYLFDPTSGPESGFETPLVSSRYGSFTTDVVLVNEQVIGSTPYDLGLERYSGAGDYIADNRSSGGDLYLGASVTGLTMGENQVIDILSLVVNPGETGRNVLEINNVSTMQPVEVLLFSPSGGLLNRQSVFAQTQVGSNGRAILDVDLTEVGAWGALIVRNASEGTQPFTYDVRFRPTPPDIATAVLPGSHGPVVPQIDGFIPIGDPVPAPDVLAGDIFNTVFYFHIANNGPADADLWDLAALVDGETIDSLEWPFGLPGGTTDIISNAYGAFTIPGGRHTAGMFFDSLNEFDEVFEDNNRFAEQWVWEPIQLALGQTVSRSTPPNATGGWDDIPAGLTRENNLDGLRTPAFAPNGSNGFFGGFALAPASGSGNSDVDLGVYPVSTGAQDGFTTPVEFSDFGGNYTEIVLFDMDGVIPPGTAFDMGAMNFSTDAGYTAHATESAWLPVDTGNLVGQNYGPFLLGGGELLGLFEFTSGNGTGLEVPIKIQVENVSGDADLTLAVFGRSDATGFYNLTETLPDGYANAGGAGAGETVNLTLPADGYFGVAVFKTTGDETGKAAEYMLHFLDPGVSPVEDLPRVVAGIENYPNPFNPMTNINFTQERAGKVTLQIYSVEGKLVRTLVNGDMQAGRHSLTWAGRDDAGRQVASGVYLARFVHPDGVANSRMVLVK